MRDGAKKEAKGPQRLPCIADLLRGFIFLAKCPLESVVFMLQKFRRKCRPTVLLLIFGFAVSFTAVLTGIGTLQSLLAALAKMDREVPIYETMQNTGLSLALAIYVFSVANCLVVTNYWILSRRRDLAIRKAFGWTNRQLTGMIAWEIAETLAASLCISGVLLALLNTGNAGAFSLRLSPFFVLGTLILLLFTLFVSVLIPAVRILQIHPAEVIS